MKPLKRLTIGMLIIVTLLACSSNKYDKLEFHNIGWDYNSKIDYSIGSIETAGKEKQFIELKLKGVPFKNITVAENSNHLIALKMYKELQAYPELEKYIVRTAYKKDNNATDTLSLEYEDLDKILGDYLKLYEKTSKDLKQLIKSGSQDYIIDQMHPSITANKEAIAQYKLNSKRNDSIGGKIIRVELHTMESAMTMSNQPVLLFKGWASRENNRKQQIEIGISKNIDNPYYHIINLK